MSDAVLCQSPKTALLIFPRGFYSFAEVVGRGLEDIGYSVVYANDEYPENILGKILGKMHFNFLLRKITKAVFMQRFIVGRKYDLVLIVKGRGVGRELLRSLRSVASRIVGYNFDSFAYNSAALEWYLDVDRYCTFDPQDARDHDLPLVPLFSSLPVEVGEKEIIYDVSAVLRNHSRRLAFVDEVLSSLPSLQRRFIYIFEMNVLTFATNVVRSPLLYWKYRRNIHFTALPYAEYTRALKGSALTIDYAHPKQAGITIRCFEALAAQTKIVTNNRQVLEHPLFGEANAFVLDKGEGRDQLRRAVAMHDGIVPARRERTVRDFLFELLG